MDVDRLFSKLTLQYRDGFVEHCINLSQPSRQASSNFLQEQYHYLRGIPLQSIDHACPLVLISSDYGHLITATEPIIMGPPGGPLAVYTRLGWALQGPANLIPTQNTFSFTFTCFKSELIRNAKRLLQIDTLPYMNEKTVTRSKHDKIALIYIKRNWKTLCSLATFKGFLVSRQTNQRKPGPT